VSVALLREDLLVDELAGLARAYAESQAFVSLLAHELRTRLMLTELALSSERRDGCDTALENTRTLQKLAETLLELARGEAGEPADPVAAVRRVLKDLRADIEIVGAEIVPGVLPVIALPQGLLETILRNLVVNALEAGATRVEVFARPDKTICVRDDGRGVPRETASAIFGVYSDKRAGAGLALMLCREILRRRGGELWLEPPSTFAFRVR
jgi:signal transduction histidine kinase